VFLSNRTEADFQKWRDERDWTERKYALWDAGKRLEPPSYGPGKPAHRFRKCPCGEVFDMHGPEAVLVHVSPRYCGGAKLSRAPSLLALANRERSATCRPSLEKQAGRAGRFEDD